MRTAEQTTGELLDLAAAHFQVDRGGLGPKDDIFEKLSLRVLLELFLAQERPDARDGPLVVAHITQDLRGLLRVEAGEGRSPSPVAGAIHREVAAWNGPAADVLATRRQTKGLGSAGCQTIEPPGHPPGVEEFPGDLIVLADLSSGILAVGRIEALDGRAESLALGRHDPPPVGARYPCQGLPE